VTDSEPGIFHRRERAAQLLSFVGLKWGTITPTDTDALIDFGGRAFVIVEVKYRDAPLPRGQELAFERAADGWERGGIPTLVLAASHQVDTGDVIVADAEVKRVYWRGKWSRPRRPRTVGQTVERFYAKYVAKRDT